MKSPITNLNKINTDSSRDESNKNFFFKVISASKQFGLVIVFCSFTVIFGSSLFVIKSNNGSSGVLASKPQNNSALSTDTLERLNIEEGENLPVEVYIYKDPFENIEVQAKAAYVFDISTGRVLYEKNKNEQLPIASLTKIMTAFVASDIADEKDFITLQIEDLEQEGNSGLRIGERWQLKDLLDFTLITSSNDGASAIASAVGVISYSNYVTENQISNETTLSGMAGKELFLKKMNDQADMIGMTSTVYYNESGLDITDDRSGAYSSVHDLTLLFEYIVQNQPLLLQATKKLSTEIISSHGIVHLAKNTNKRVEYMSGLIASKTGYTDLAGGNLGVVFDSGLGNPIIVVVLGSTIDGRFEDVNILSQAALNAVGQGVF